MSLRYVHITAVLLCCFVVFGALPQSSFGLVIAPSETEDYQSAPTGDADPGWGNVGAMSIGSGVYLGDGWVLAPYHVYQYQHDDKSNRVGYAHIDLDQRYDEILGTFKQIIRYGKETDLAMFRINGNPDLDLISIRDDRFTSTYEEATIIATGRYRSGSERDFVVGSDTYSGFDITPLASRLKQWGTNDVRYNGVLWGTTDTIVSTFDIGDASEAQPVDRDSGGAVFTDDGVSWELAGMLVAVQGQNTALQTEYEANFNAIYGNFAYYANLSTYSSQISDIRKIPLPGDITNDGAVDIEDVYKFNTVLGQAGTNMDADFNNDNVVNLEDFAILRGNFGKISGSGFHEESSSAPAPTPAPEPATIFVLFSAVPLLIKSRNRRRKA